MSGTCADVPGQEVPGDGRRAGGTLRQAILGRPRLLDAELDPSSQASEILSYVYESLVDLHLGTGGAFPKLAETWEIRDLEGPKEPGQAGGGLSITFHLRRGIRFQDGQPFTAKDVEFTWRLLRHPKNGLPHLQEWLGAIAECLVLDDYTVRMRYSRKDWMALRICGAALRIRPHRAWDPDGLLGKDPELYFERFPNDPLALCPIGTGPYQVGKWTPDSEIPLKRFEGYWDPAAPRWPDEIRFCPFKDRAARMDALEQGRIDFALQLSPEEMDRFFSKKEREKEFARIQAPTPRFEVLAFNLRRELWKDLRVRRAVALGAPDPGVFIREGLKGQGTWVTSDFSWFRPRANPEIVPLLHDPPGAASLLEEAGWSATAEDTIRHKEGRRLQFEVITRDLPSGSPAVLYLTQMEAGLKEIGMRMVVKRLDWNAFFERLTKRDFDACWLGYSFSDLLRLAESRELWHSAKRGPGEANVTGFAHPEVDRWIEEEQREQDPERRAELYSKIQGALAREHPQLWLYSRDDLGIRSRAWQGARFWLAPPGHRLSEWYQAP